jgi:hypothetical protein
MTRPPFLLPVSQQKGTASAVSMPKAVVESTEAFGEYRAGLGQRAGGIGLVANDTRMVWESLASYIVREGSTVT